MKLFIPRVLAHHFGVYACKAKNPRGDTDGIITLTGNTLKSISRKIRNILLNGIFIKVDVEISNNPQIFRILV